MMALGDSRPYCRSGYPALRWPELRPPSALRTSCVTVFTSRSEKQRPEPGY